MGWPSPFNFASFLFEMKIFAHVSLQICMCVVEMCLHVCGWMCVHVWAGAKPRVGPFLRSSTLHWGRISPRTQSLPIPVWLGNLLFPQVIGLCIQGLGSQMLSKSVWLLYMASQGSHTACQALHSSTLHLIPWNDSWWNKWRWWM